MHRRLLYRWRDQLEPAESREGPPPVNSSETTLRKEVSRLKPALAAKTLEVDFVTGALREYRLDASGAATLAGRHLRPHPGRDGHSKAAV